MLNVDVGDDSPGMGMQLLRKALTKAKADDFFATWEANVVTADDVAEWASWGTKNKMNTARLAINYHDVSSADGVYIDAGFQWIDQFVAWCKAHKIYVILDMHSAPGSQNCEEMGDTTDGVAHLWSEPAKYRQWTINLWQHIAQRYANEPYVMGFDLFDEPYSNEKERRFRELRRHHGTEFDVHRPHQGDPQGQPPSDHHHGGDPLGVGGRGVQGS